MGNTYAITEIFHTIQGEGAHAGRCAIFLRFAACNLWSGKPQDRERDALRHEAHCPRWCDTDFAMRERLSLGELGNRIAALPRAPLIVLTGGEPLLQVDAPLVEMLERTAIDTIAVETNGTVLPPPDLHMRLWLTMSPKVAPNRLALRNVDELKVVFPDYDPQSYINAGVLASHYFVQPRAACKPESVGKSVLAMDSMQQAAAYVMKNPHWRLSIQTHKLVGVP